MKNRSIVSSDARKALPFILPGILISVLLIIYPLVYVIRMSFMKNNGMGVSGFAGFRNYTKLFSNPQFGQAISNTVVWTLSTVILSFLFGFLFALIIENSSIKYKGFWRSLIFIAWVIPGVVKATTWKWLFSTEGGMVNSLLQSAGLIHTAIPWLTDSKYAMIAIVIVQVWACAPYVMLMMTAGLQQMPKDIYESADLDGANIVQKTLFITFPMLQNVTFICVLLLFIWAINEFSLIWIMTNGGPGGSTMTLSILIYNQFKILNLNAASASAIMQLIISIAFALVYVKVIMKEEG